MPVVPIEYIEVDQSGIPRVAGSNVTVLDLVLDRAVHGGGADDVQARHPQLSRAEVYAAFAYYYDHQAAIDAAVEQRLGPPFENLSVEFE